MEGINNEISIVEYLNTTSFENLKESHKVFFTKINNGVTPTTITAKRNKSSNKADICITIDNIEHFVSIKQGDGNSVHQEKIESFISYLKGIDDNDEVFHYLREFIWGDGTTNGTGSIKDRIDSKAFLKTFKTKAEIIQEYFDKHMNILIERFVITGKSGKESANYIWYGGSDGYIMDKQEFMNRITSKRKTNLSIGTLTFQAWNRALTNMKQEKRRGQIQIKWSGIGREILKTT